MPLETPQHPVDVIDVPIAKPMRKTPPWRTRRKILAALVFLLLATTLGIWQWNPNVDFGPVPRRPAVVPVRFTPGPLSDGQKKHIDQALTFIQSQINPDTRLAYSFSGDNRLEYWSVVYDNCIRALVHLRTGRVDLARAIIDYFIDDTAIQKIGWVKKQGKVIKRPGWIVNIVDASEDRAGGRGIEHIAHTGPNAYLGLVSLHIYKETGQKRYLEFARKQWDLLKDLQNEDPKDPNFGGIRMGPMGNPENQHEQRLDFKPWNPSYYEFYNGEHAADFKGFSDLMAVYDPERKERYEHAAQLIQAWDKKIYNADKHLFYIGTTERRYFDPNIGKWIEPGLIPMFPLDTSALKISAYGVQGLEVFGPGTALKIRRAIDDHFRVRVSIPGPDGKPMTIEGYDFVSDLDRPHLIRYIEMGSFGDKKINKGVGREPILTDEWSNWVALADLRMAADFEAMGRSNDHRSRMNAYYENAVVMGVKTAIPTERGLAYPYAHPLPAALNKPVGFGWNTHHKPYAIIGGAARTLGLLRFDPFLPSGGRYSTYCQVTDAPLARRPPADHSRRVLYTEAELYLRDAWRDVRIAQINGPNADRYWERALSAAQKMLKEHKDWIEIAYHQNQSAALAREKWPLREMGNLTVRELEPVYRKYWALYHVGTAQFIVVMAYASLRDLAKERGEFERANELHEKAVRAALKLKTDFPYAQAYDENGWLWQPVQALHEYVELPES